MTDNILQYESEIWATADLLRGCGIKESECPSYMMPFFALIMIESRLLRLLEEETYDDFAKIYRRYCALNRQRIGNYFFKETEDLVNKLCDDFDATVQQTV
jgi:hypothetical protein